MVKQFVYKIPVSRDQEEANGGTVSDTKKCQITKLDLQIENLNNFKGIDGF